MYLLQRAVFSWFSGAQEEEGASSVLPVEIQFKLLRRSAPDGAALAEEDEMRAPGAMRLSGGVPARLSAPSRRDLLSHAHQFVRCV